MDVKSIVSFVQVLSIVVGVAVSILSFNAAREKEAEVSRIEAAKPFLQLRQDLYAEVLKVAGTLANPETHTEDELQSARKRFRELYVVELSMVEAPEVETAMVALAKVIDPELTNLSEKQRAAYNLAHAVRDSFVQSYGTRE